MDISQFERITAALKQVRPNGVPSKPPTSHSLPLRTDCILRKDSVGSVLCQSCGGKVELKVFQCEKHGECTVAKPSPGKACCATCPDRRTDWPLQFDQRNLWPGTPGLRFNPSIIEWAGGYAFCARNGWKGSEIYAGFMDRNFMPVGDPVKLELDHPEANYGKEDGRLFIHNGKLHIAFAGVVGGKHIRHTSVLIARMGAKFKVEHVECPHMEWRQTWEKNISPFSHNRAIHGVYSIRPHQIVRWVDGKGELVADEPFDIPWTGGVWRGGAAPVLVGNEWWHFAHDRITVNNVITYRTLLYAFSTNPPFKPTRYVHEPLLVADASTKPKDQYCACVFVGGCIRDGDDWVLAHGVQDRWSELHRFNHAELESRLQKVS